MEYFEYGFAALVIPFPR